MLVLALLLAATPMPGSSGLKTPSTTFGASTAIELRDGYVYLGRLDPRDAGWALMPPEGLPAPKGRLEALKELLPLTPFAFHRPRRIVALTADGDNLIAISDEGAVYYTKLSTLEWTDAWGPTGLRSVLHVEPGDRGLAMSHRLIAYTDLDQNTHPVSGGVTTLYRLSADGQALTYADPWLPPKWNHEVCLPLRGRFVAASLAASASTLFVMDEAGRSFTRLIDFDTMGGDPALRYSYAREKRTGLRADIRTLPAEDWLPQPAIPGPHTTRITIVQTGDTNADRELRVEGDRGTWRKPLTDPQWAFTHTGVTALGQLVTPRPPPLGPDRDRALDAPELFFGAKASLRQFNPRCSPALLRLELGAESVELPLHFHSGLLGSVESLSGALLLSKPSAPTRRLDAWAGGLHHLDVLVTVARAEVIVRDASKLHRFELHFPRPPE